METEAPVHKKRKLNYGENFRVATVSPPCTRKIRQSDVELRWSSDHDDDRDSVTSCSSNELLDPKVHEESTYYYSCISRDEELRSDYSTMSQLGEKSYEKNMTSTEEVEVEEEQNKTTVVEVVVAVAVEDDKKTIMPSELEIDDFFAKAEKEIQQKFIQKYNFDIVKEQPLEGRYEWVKLSP
ncbi:hypothetical protein ACFE04_003333 [Oxalis oulophora]